MRTILLALLSVGVAVMLGCVQTTSYEVPSQIDTNTSFQAVVYTEVVDSLPLPGQTFTGLLAVLIPIGWSVDSVCLDGYGYSDFMIPTSSGWISEYEYPPGSGYEWISYGTSEHVTGDLGDTGHANVFITSGDVPGSYTTAALGAFLANQPYIAYFWEGDPCSCLVEVTPLNLEQETWGKIKSEF